MTSTREAAAQALYDAEVALHAARQTHLDEWIRAAGDRLHDAVLRYEAACAAAVSVRVLETAA